LLRMQQFPKLVSNCIVCLLIIIAIVDALSPKEAFDAAYPKIIGYWGCNPGGHSSTISQLSSAISRGYNVIIFAFFDVDASGALIPDPGAVHAPTKGNITSQSFTYLISLFGGQNGAAPTLQGDFTTWAKSMYSNFLRLHQQLGIDGIDIDLENAWGGTPNTVECGLREFFKLMKSGGFVVSMAPQTTAITPEVALYAPGSWNSYVPLADTSIAQYVDVVAVQLYNNAVPMNDVTKYCSALTGGFSVTGCPCSATGRVQIAASKIAFGYPATVGAAPSGCPGLPGGCPYGSALTRLYQSSPSLLKTGGVMTWAVEWDEVGGWAFVSAAKAIKFTG